MSYTCRASGPGWIRTVGIFKDGLATTGAGFVDAFGIPVNTQCTPFNWYPSGAIQHAVMIARVTKAGPHTVTFDPPPLTSPLFTPMWPKASITFAENGVTYSAFLPEFTDMNPWVTGPLAVERRIVLVPSVGGAKHPLVSVICDVCSYADNSHRIVFGLTNGKDIPTATRVTMSSLTLSVNGSNIYGPGTYTLFEGQYGIQVGLAGGHLSARMHMDTQMWRDAQAFPDIMQIVESPNYIPNYIMGGFDDMTDRLPMQVGGGSTTLGPVFTKAQAEYVVHQTDAIYDFIIAQANCAGSYAGFLMGPDGVTFEVDPDHGNKGQGGDAGYGQYHLLEGAHLLHLTTVAFVLSADPCYLNLTQSWGEEIMEGNWDGPANPISYSGGAAAANTFLDYDYNKHVDGQICFLGASGFAEPRYIGRTLSTLIDSATYTPAKLQPKLKSSFKSVVEQNIARLDISYARRPFFGLFNVPGIEFDPGKGLGNSYGAVHLLYASISFWQWFEVAMSLYHAYRNGYKTDLGMLKRICGSFLLIWEKVPKEHWGKIAVMYYPRFGHKVPDGPLTPFTTVDEFLAANWGPSPPPGAPAWDGDDNNGNPGYDYYAQEHYTLLQLGRWLGLKSPVLDDAIAFMRPRMLASAVTRAHYAFLIGDDTISITTPPIDQPPVVVPPTGGTSKVVTATIRASQKEANSDPSTLTNKLQITLTTPSPVVVTPPPPPATGSPQVRVSYDPPAISLAPSEVKKVKAIANNAGIGKATEEAVSLGLPAEVEVVEAGANYDKAADKWAIGEIAGNTQVSMDVSLRPKVQP